MNDIAENLNRILSTLPEGVTLTAVSKFHPVEALQQAYDAGQRIFGESRAQELVKKATQLPADIEWHFIGHLQTNKVRSIIPHVAMIQSIDSPRLLQAVSDEAARINRCVDVLLQLHVAKEETKFGFTPDEISDFAPQIAGNYPGVRVAGVMGMASNTDDFDRVRDDFDAIRRIFHSLANGAMKSNPAFRHISMGMSHDYKIALSCGSTMVRIGTDIFGEREY